MARAPELMAASVSTAARALTSLITALTSSHLMVLTGGEAPVKLPHIDRSSLSFVLGSVQFLNTLDSLRGKN